MSVNPSYYRSAPLDPHSRLPSSAEPTGLIAFDFGSALPHKVLRGKIDKERSQRQDLRTADGSGYDVSRSNARARSAPRKRSNTNRTNHAVITEQPGRHGIILQNVDIGAGTAADSLVAHFPTTAVPFSQPFLADQSLYSRELEAPRPVATPMNPRQFNAAIQQLRNSAAAVGNGARAHERGSDRERAERDAYLSRRPATASSPPASSSEAAHTIEGYLNEHAKLKKKQSQKERERYEKRVAQLEATLLKMKDENERREAREAWEASEQAYQKMMSDAIANEAPPPTADKQQLMQQLQSDLRSGHVLDNKFKDNLTQLKQMHSSNLHAIEDLYYQQKLTKNLSNTLANASQQQLSYLEHQSPRTQQQQPLVNNYYPPPNQPSLYHSHSQPIQPLSEQEIRFRAQQNLVRNQQQTHGGVADEGATDPEDRREKMKLAMQFAPSEVSYASQPYAAARHAPPPALEYSDTTSSVDGGVQYDVNGNPIWNEVVDDPDRALRHEQRTYDKAGGVKRHSLPHSSKHSSQRHVTENLRQPAAPSVDSFSSRSSLSSHSSTHEHAPDEKHDDRASSGKSSKRSHSSSRSRSPHSHRSPTHSSTSSSVPYMQQPRSAPYDDDVATEDRSYVDVPLAPPARDRDIAPAVDDGTPANAHTRVASVNPRQNDVSPTRHNKKRPSSAHPLINPASLIPSPNSHDARDRALRRDQSKPINMAHAFGPGRVIDRPATADRTRNRTRSRSRGDIQDESARRLTEPQPFHVGASSPDNQQSIPRSKQRFYEYLAEVKSKEEEHLNKTFKANPLPVSTLQPRYKEMVEQQKARSREIRRERRKLTREMVKPFAFSASKELERRRRRQERAEKGLPPSDSEEESKSNRSPSRSRSRSRSRPPASDTEHTATNTDVDDAGDEDGSEARAHPLRYSVAFGQTTRPKSVSPTKYKSDTDRDASPAPAAPTTPAFKAKKIPYTSTVNMLDTIVKEREEQRKKRIEERAKQLRASSSLPRRMAMHERERQKEVSGSGSDSGTNRKKKEKWSDPVPKPHINTAVPDFERLHAEFAADLDRVKKSKELTRPEEFKFGYKPKPKPVEQEKPKQFHARPYIPPPPPEDLPGSTKNVLLMKEKNRRAIEEREAKKREEEETIKAKQKSNPEMKKTLIPNIIAGHSHGAESTKDKIKQLTKQAKKDMDAADRQWAERVAEMKERVRNRPLLVQSYNSAAGRIEARKKALLAIKESLDKAGIVDQKRFFDQQELIDLDLHFD